jgi:hypothetical protein
MISPPDRRSWKRPSYPFSRPTAPIGGSRLLSPSRSGRQVQRLERNSGLSTEALALFVRFWLTITSPLSPDARASAQVKGPRVHRSAGSAAESGTNPARRNSKGCGEPISCRRRRRRNGTLNDRLPPPSNHDRILAARLEQGPMLRSRLSGGRPIGDDPRGQLSEQAQRARRTNPHSLSKSVASDRCAMDWGTDFRLIEPCSSLRRPYSSGR